MLDELLKIIVKNFKIISIFVFGITLFVLIFSLLLPKKYLAEATILLPDNNQMGLGALSMLSNIPLAGGLLGDNEAANRYIAIVKSKTMKEKMNAKFDFMKRYGAENMEEVFEKIDYYLSVDIGDESQIEIAFVDKDQEKVADMTSYIVECLDSLTIQLSNQNAKNRKEFVFSRIELVLDSLKTLEDSIKTFMQNTGVNGSPDQITAAISVAANIKAQIMSKQIELEILRNSLNLNNPKITEIELQIKSIEKTYAKFYDGDSNKKLFPNLAKIPTLQLQMIRLEREAEYYTKLLEYLGPQYEEARIEEAKQIPTIQVLDHPRRPDEKYKPKIKFLVITAFLGSLLLSIVAVALKEKLMVQINYQK